MSESHVSNQPTTTSSRVASNSAEPTVSASRPAEEQNSASGEAARPRGVALPGDRGPRNQGPEAQRPSFWRRIALGRRAVDPRPNPQSDAREPNRSIASQRKSQLVIRAEPTGKPTISPETVAFETRIVEPLLQALVSVEAKLERSHSDLLGRSDQVEQRLTQLWDIEEQLGTLSELQDSLLHVSEQQRRLESAVVSQTRTLRWLVGAVFFSLASAAFVVAAILR